MRKMAEDIRMDSHKLIYHPARVAAWLKGETIYPIELEVGLSGACNHRCIFCAVDYMEYKPVFLSLKVMADNLKICGQKGVKSVIYAGEGEPLLNPNAPEIFNLTKENGIDAALSTNGVLLTEEKASACLKSLTWVRFSIAGATEKTYSTIHRAKPGDLTKALANMESAVAVKRRQKLPVTLGAQMLLLPENKAEVIELAKIMREIGLDYFTVKPFSQHPSSKAKINVDYSEAAEIWRELHNYETEDFKIYFRSQSIENLTQKKSYDECHGLPFMAHITASGDVCPCVVFMDGDFCYGNINEETFDKIWESERAREIRSRFSREFISKYCRQNCRLDEMNKYLHTLKNPGGHVNFI